MQESKTHKPDVKKTPGEKSFDLLTYWGIGGLLNAALSLKFFKYTHYEWENLSAAEQATHKGKQIHDMMYDWAAKLSKPLEPILGEGKIVDGKAVGALKHSQRFMLGSILGLGGWAVLAGIKPLEDNKAKVVESLNDIHGFDMSEAQKKELRNEPKQSWGSLLGGRTMAFFTPILAAAPIMDVYEKMRGQEIFDDLADITRRNFGGTLRLEKYIPNMTREAGRQWTKTGLAEAFYTSIGVTVLYGMSKVIANKNQDNDPYGDIDIPKHPVITGTLREQRRPGAKVAEVENAEKLATLQEERVAG